MCEGFIKLFCENFTFIHSSTKQHHLILSLRQHFLYNNLKELLHIFTLYSVLSDTGILDVEGENAVPNFDVTYKII